MRDFAIQTLLFALLLYPHNDFFSEMSISAMSNEQIDSLAFSSLSAVCC
jgi:hypothetical protein